MRDLGKKFEVVSKDFCESINRPRVSIYMSPEMSEWRFQFNEDIDSRTIIYPRIKTIDSDHVCNTFWQRINYEADVSQTVHDLTHSHYRRLRIVNVVIIIEICTTQRS